MIDIDKYTGHTPNEWIVEEGANGDTLVSSFHPNEDGLQTDIALIYTNQIDAQLIADAPLLLEEVKRLRGLLDTIIDITLKELKIFDDNCPMINIRDLAYKGIMWGSKNDD